MQHQFIEQKLAFEKKSFLNQESSSRKVYAKRNKSYSGESNEIYHWVKSLEPSHVDSGIQQYL